MIARSVALVLALSLFIIGFWKNPKFFLDDGDLESEKKEKKKRRKSGSDSEAEKKEKKKRRKSDSDSEAEKKDKKKRRKSGKSDSKYTIVCSRSKNVI